MSDYKVEHVAAGWQQGMKAGELKAILHDLPDWLDVKLFDAHTLDTYPVERVEVEMIPWPHGNLRWIVLRS